MQATIDALAARLFFSDIRRGTGFQVAAIDSAVDFAKAVLFQAQALEWALARYGKDGRVGQVRPAAIETADMDSLQRLLPWLKHENGLGAAIWCRPADAEHPWLMLDDISTQVGYQLSKKYATLVIETSPGNAQALILADRALSAPDRTSIRRALTRLIGADPGAISEPRWCRCPGFRSGKQGRPWTNLLTDTTRRGARLDPSPWIDSSAVPVRKSDPTALPRARTRPRHKMPGEDASGKEFAFACRSLAAGVPRDVVVARVAEHAFARGKRADWAQTHHYAERLVAAAAALKQGGGSRPR